jgi:parallel beta-helix repeat protein
MNTLEQIEPRTPITNLPYTIMQPGSFFLTGNLSGATGIVIAASGVTLDLMGFEIAAETPSFTSGIRADGVRSNITIRNGTVRGWLGQGVNMFNARNSLLEQLRVSDNIQSGILTGSGSMITSCSATRNVVNGISAGDGNVVRDCTATTNGNTGIFVGGQSLILNSTATDNGNFGMGAGSHSRIENCVARGHAIDGFNVTGENIVIANSSAGANQRYGIYFFLGTGGEVRQCTVVGSGSIGIWGAPGSILRDNTSRNNGEDGILAESDSLVVGNLCEANTNNGIRVQGGSGVRIESNHVINNGDIGILIIGADNLIIKNSARGNANGNYSIQAGNQDGPIGDMSVVQYEPWGNFDF